MFALGRYHGRGTQPFDELEVRYQKRVGESKQKAKIGTFLRAL